MSEETPADQADSPASETTSQQSADATAETSTDKPSERIKIGTQRGGSVEDARPKPVMPFNEKRSEPAPSKYPPPNVRAQLTPELEAELEAALGGQSLDQLIETSTEGISRELASDSRVTGRVTRQHGDSVFFDLGGHLEGVVKLQQFEEDAHPETGAEMELVVVRIVDGLYELSLPHAAIEVGDWDDVSEGQVVEVAVTGVNKGGLECQVAGIKGFMPMGQISLYRVETPEDYVGQRLACVVTEANRGKGNLVLSHRGVMERERAAKRDKLMAELAPGQVREGVVRSLRDFGAFVDLGGVDGLVHVSKMSWERVNHPSEVLSEGQAVKVKVESIDQETGKIGLSYRESAENPWDGVDAKFPVGSSVSGKVTKLMDFGAFVRLEAGVEGLIHISELAHGRVMRASDVVSEGQDVVVKVLSVERDKQRIGLSLKALTAGPARADARTADEDMPLPTDAPKAPLKRQGNLKGGIGAPTGGEHFGLKW
ncbi:30S ribosomal protein S1 [Posidoniimonas polymericola]|uniref:30S ribosomal protein S1 n=1 Tax=Posidoniimonas polymericola TaxID=2528002 RepID=A0A5C5YEN9_9BACT|nr:S1 RNA-binding domain-containing protein [Posidoniimonas polymericola]TWT73458.1 30S ribosomal protein S1 [Posidoniimonas polymericola]